MNLYHITGMYGRMDDEELLHHFDRFVVADDAEEVCQATRRVYPNSSLYSLKLESEQVIMPGWWQVKEGAE